MAGYTFDELVNALEIQKANVPTYLTELGATSAQVTELSKQLDNLKASSDYAELAGTVKKTAYAIKQAQFNGDPDEPSVPYPPISAGSVPDPSQGVGYLAKFLARNRLWLASPGCTPEIAIACALKRVTEAPDAATVQPTIDCDAAQSGNVVTVIVKNRGESDMYDVLGCPVTETQLKLLKSAKNRSTDITLPPKDGGGSQQWQMQVQLKKNDQPYGQLSDIVRVTANP